MKILRLDRHHAPLNENMIILHAMNYEYITFIKRCHCHCTFFKPKGLSDHQKVIIIQNKEFETQTNRVQHHCLRT